METNNEIKTQCRELGLDPETIYLHAQRIKSALAGDNLPHLKIIDTCRLDNQGILPQNSGKGVINTNAVNGFVAFVPAAGASSRFFSPFSDLIATTAAKDLAGIESALKALVEKEVSSWSLPKGFKDVITSWAGKKLNSESLLQFQNELHDALDFPKALVPCVLEGDTFLDLKIAEHAALKSFLAEVYVVAPSYKDIIQKRLSEKFAKLSRVLVQGPKQSTIRFKADGKPVLEKDGRLSLVPAGHGTLTSVMHEVGESFPKAHSVFIRNIDNIMGTSSEVVGATKVFLAQHQFILERMQNIRRCLGQGATKAAADFAIELKSIVSSNAIDSATQKFLDKLSDSDERFLWELQCRLFHFKTDSLNGQSATATSKLLKNLYARPLNCLGQVPNTQKDVGGTPVFAQSQWGDLKICLEVPHASPADKEKFLENPCKATHFNPVFVAAELGFDALHYEQSDRPFWLLAEKTYKGEKVYYHETLLYELLGNSILANTVFIEVPRCVFHPHKSFADIAGKSCRDWQ